MAKQIIKVGTTANDRKGDSLRIAFQKVNANFTELYTALGLDVAPLNLGAFEFSGSTMSTTDSTAITIDQATTITSNLTVGGDLLPSVANGGDLGSLAKPWKSLYVSGSTIYLGGAALKIDNEGELTLNDNRIVQQNGQYIDLNSNVNDVNVSNPQPGDTLQWGPGFWINVPNSDHKLVSGAKEVVLTGGTNPFVTFPAVATGENIYIQGAEIASTTGTVAITSSNSAVVNTNALTTLKTWTFGDDGNLTIPGDIRSEGDINIDINLGDSTLRRWTFTEGGDLRFPDGTTQTTAYTGSESSGGSDLEFEAYYVYQSNMDAEATKFKGNRDNKPLNALRELRLSGRALDAANTEISVRSQLDMLVEQPRVSELTMTLTSDTTKTFNYEVTHISRNVYQTDYRGYTGRFVRSFSNDSGIIRVIIGRGNTSTILFDPRANNEDWMVNTGDCSTIMSFMIADHSAYIRKDREKITKFFEAVIDNIAFDGATEITDAAVMRTRFYANIDTLVSAIGGNLYYDFRAYNSTRTFTNVPISSATSTVAAGITIRAQNTGKYQDWVGIDTPGEGFQVGQTIVIPGSSLDQYSEYPGQQQNGVHDATVTVTEVDGVGGITNFTVSGTGIGRWGSDNISDGEDDQFDTSMRYQTNLLQTLYRFDGSSQTSLDYLNYNSGLVTEDDRAVDAFGTGSKYVISFHKGIVSLFATGVSNSVTWFSITGNSGRDGGGTVDEGEVRIGTVYRLFVRCHSGPEYFAVNNDKFYTTLRSTDRLGLIEIVNPSNDQNTVENDIYLQSLHTGDFYIKGNDNLILTANRDVTVQASNGVSSAREGYDVFISGGDGIADDRLNSNPTGQGGGIFIESGQGGTIQHTITAMTNASPAVITLTDRIRIGDYTLVSFLIDGDLGNSISSTTTYYAVQISETEIEIYRENGGSPLDTSSMPAFTSGTVIIGDRAGSVSVSSLHPAAIFHGELELNHFVWPNTHQSAVAGQILQVSSDTSVWTGHKKLVFNNDLNLIGDIRSENVINIDINLSDSTLRRWTFGEDGVLNIPGGIKTSGFTIDLSTYRGVDDAGLGDYTITIDGNNIRSDKDSIGLQTVNGYGIVVDESSKNVLLGDLSSGVEINLLFGSESITGENWDAQLKMPNVGGPGVPSSFSITTQGDTNVWTFGGDGTLEIPGDIRSEGNINIDINLSDSTLRRWTFGEDGELTFPNNTVQTTAYTGPENPFDQDLNINNSPNFVNMSLTGTAGAGYATVSIATNRDFVIELIDQFTGAKTFEFGRDGSLTIPGDIKSEGNINIDINLSDSTLRRWTFGEDGNTEFPGAITVPGTITGNILKIEDGVHEKFQTKADATGTVTHDCSAGHIFFHTSPDANWTANFTNLNLSSGYATTVTLVIEQGGTGYYPDAVQIGGNGVGILWQGNATPTPSTNRIDVVTFSILYDGLYTVLGQLTGF